MSVHAGGWWRAARRIVPSVIATAVLALPASSQSLTGGAVTGTVRDATGEPIFDVIVTAESVSGGAARADTTLRDGRFTMDYLPPGEYNVLAERIGFRPQRVMGVTVRPGRTVQVPMQIEEVQGTPESVDEVAWDGGVSSAGAAGLSMGASRQQLLRLPSASRTFLDAARLSSFTGSDLSARGLPASYSGFIVDGVPVRGARHPLLGAGTARAAPLRLSSFDQLEVILDDPDVELSGFIGTVVAAHGRRGGREFSIDGFAEGTAAALTSSKHFDAADASGTSLRGGVVLGGPIVPDTAHFAVGLEIFREEMPRGPLLDADSSAAAAAVLERLEGGLAPLGSPFASSLETVTGFGSIDWQITDVHRVFARMDVARVGSAEASLVGGGIASTSSGTDLLLSGGLSSRIGFESALEFRFGLDRSSRDYEQADDPAAAPWTAVADGSLAFGMSPWLAGAYTTSSLFLSEAYLMRTEQHYLKFGAGAWLSSHERSLVSEAPAFYFPDALGVAAREGLAVERTSDVTPASFSTRQFFGFVQDRWSVSPELELLVGVRAELEQLPLEDVPLDEDWRSLSGLDNIDVLAQPEVKISPRLGFTWDLGGQGRYFLRGSAGTYHDVVDPDILAEVLGEIGNRNVRFREGAVGGWPAPPTGGTVTEAATTSILTTKFRAPKSDRGAAGLGVSLGAGFSIDVSGSYTQTSFLPRRIDLNQLPGRVWFDQNGRPIYGELVKNDGLLYAEPGSNRRFTLYDHVYAIHSDGTSESVGISAGLERNVAGSSFFARYTHTQTTDDWLNAGLAPRGLGLSPFPDTAIWVEGTADHDVPHRFVAGLDVPVPGTPVRISGFYRFESGRPFTPGFGSGVDLNADGVFGNDPAFATGDAVSELASDWPCIRQATDGFVERNACRDPDTHRLDLRVSADLPIGQQGALAVFVDALDLLEADVAIRDHALYRVDPTAALDYDSGAGRVNVPLVVNSGFGNPLIRLTSGRMLRLGLQLRY